MKRIVAFLFIVLAALCLQQPLVRGQDYIVGEGDVLEIKVYDLKDLDTTVRVSGEGLIDMPLLGQVKVGGMEVTAIARQLETLLADGYVKSPQVNVFIKEYRSRKATVLGQVEKPGLCELQGAVPLLELISRAGGLTKDAGGQITIKRKKPGDEGEIQTITMDMKKLIEEGDTALNMAVQDGDSIYIGKAGVYYVTGEVGKPSSYKFEANPSVIKAITMAGGFTNRAARGKVRIIRTIDGEKKVLESVDMDEPVLEDDVIVVPERFF